MNIGLIGCGKVGTTLFYLLKKSNRLVGVYDSNKRNQEKAMKLLHIKAHVSLKEVCERSEALFFATPDDRIVKAYGEVKRFIRREKCVYHFSGLLPARIFPKRKGIYRASVHPFSTFPKVVIPPSCKKYTIFVEGDVQAIKAVQKIFAKRFFNIRCLKRNQKTHYHLIGVFSSNLLVGLLAAISELVKKVGWKDQDIYEIVFPIIEETLNNAKRNHIRNALSGPLERGDREIVKKHLKALKKDRDLLNMYKTISICILHNLTKGKKSEEIEKLLQNEC